MQEAIRLIVGLGNPGEQYERTRHNVGMWFVERLAHQAKTTFRDEKKFHGLIARIDTPTEPCWLLMPRTFMNESGRSVSALANFYKISISSILVVHDELDFPAGTIRFKQGGGHGGHNGLRSIIECLNSSDFYRLRIGIGHPGHRDRVSPYVLSAPSHDDEIKINQAIDQATQLMPEFMSGKFQNAIQKLHSE